MEKVDLKKAAEEWRENRVLITNEQHEAVDNIANLFKKLNLSNIHEYFYVYCYMLWNGYFSVDKSYAYNRKGLNAKNSEYAVFLGKGTSTQAAELLTELLNKKHLKARTIDLRVKKVKLNDVMNIKRRFETELKDFKNCQRGTNQRVTMLYSVDKAVSTTLFDPILLAESEILYGGKLNCVNGKYKVDKGLLLHRLDNPFFKEDEDLPKRATLDHNIVLESYDKARSLCEHSLDCFEQFYQENKSHYDAIKRLIKK